MSFAGSELINGNVSELTEFSSLQAAAQIFLENPFDQIPSHPQEEGHGLDGGDGAQLDHKTLEGSQRATFGFGQIDGFPQDMMTAPTVLFMPVKNHLLRPLSNGQCMKDPDEPPSLSQMVPPGRAAPAEPLCVFPPHMVQHGTVAVLGAKMPVVLQAQGVVEIACRRHNRPPLDSGFSRLRMRDTASATIFL
jgi:hypothetical protein